MLRSKKYPSLFTAKLVKKQIETKRYDALSRYINSTDLFFPFSYRCVY